MTKQSFLTRLFFNQTANLLLRTNENINLLVMFRTQSYVMTGAISSLHIDVTNLQYLSCNIKSSRWLFSPTLFTILSVINNALPPGIHWQWNVNVSDSPKPYQLSYVLYGGSWYVQLGVVTSPTSIQYITLSYWVTRSWLTLVLATLINLATSLNLATGRT